MRPPAIAIDTARPATARVAGSPPESGTFTTSVFAVYTASAEAAMLTPPTPTARTLSAPPDFGSTSTSPSSVPYGETPKRDSPPRVIALMKATAPASNPSCGPATIDGDPPSHGTLAIAPTSSQYTLSPSVTMLSGFGRWLASVIDIPPVRGTAMTVPSPPVVASSVQ
jgi:hypothetical protein